MSFDKFGCYKKGVHSATPYRHHLSKWTWQVQIVDKVGEEEYMMKSIKVIARTAIEACVESVKSYEKQKVEKEQYMRERILAKKLESEYATETHPEET